MYSLHRFIDHWIFFFVEHFLKTWPHGTQKKSLKHLPAQPMVSSSTGRDFCCFGTLNGRLILVVVKCHPSVAFFGVYILFNAKKVDFEPPKNIAHNIGKTPTTHMIPISLSKLYLNFMGFHRNLQANRLPFYPLCLHGSQIFKNDGFFWAERRVDEWKPTQLAGWIFCVKWKNSEKWLGNKRMYWFLSQELWNVCLFAFFSVPNVEMCHPFFSRFLKQEKWERSPSTATPAMFFVFSFRIWEMPRFFPDLPWTWRLWSCLAWLCESRVFFCRDPKTKLRFWQKLP